MTHNGFLLKHFEKGSAFNNGLEKVRLKRTTHKLLIEEADHFHKIIPDDWFTLSPKKGGKKGRGK